MPFSSKERRAAYDRARRAKRKGAERAKKIPVKYELPIFPPHEEPSTQEVIDARAALRVLKEELDLVRKGPPGKDRAASVANLIATNVRVFGLVAAVERAERLERAAVPTGRGLRDFTDEEIDRQIAEYERRANDKRWEQHEQPGSESDAGSRGLPPGGDFTFVDVEP